MKILVCVKQTFDTEAKIKPTGDGKSVEREGITLVLNPYDEYAVEEALRIKEAGGDVEITALSVGPPSALEAVHTCYAMGVDEGAHVIGDDLFLLCPGLTAELLAAAIGKLGDFDLILCGRSAVDDETQAVPVYLAEKLGLPQLLSVTELNVENGSITATRDIEGGKETLKVSLPAVVSAQKGLNDPRYPSILGIRKAKKRDATTFTPEDLGVDVTAHSAITKIELPPERAAGVKIEGESTEAAKKLAEVLAGEL